MENTVKAFLYGVGSVLDITGARGLMHLKKIAYRSITHGYRTDKNSLSQDFYTSINNLIK